MTPMALRARISAMCASRSVNAAARGSRSSASNPMKRPARERSGQHSTRYGRASGQAGVGTHQELRIGGARASGAHQYDVALGNQQRPGTGLQVLDGLLQQVLQFVGAIGGRGVLLVAA